MIYFDNIQLTELPAYQVLYSNIPPEWIRVPYEGTLRIPKSYQKITGNKVRFMILKGDEYLGENVKFDHMVFCTKTPRQIDAYAVKSKLDEILMYETPFTDIVSELWCYFSQGYNKLKEIVDD